MGALISFAMAPAGSRGSAGSWNIGLMAYHHAIAAMARIARMLSRCGALTSAGAMGSASRRTAMPASDPFGAGYSIMT